MAIDLAASISRGIQYYEECVCDLSSGRSCGGFKGETWEEGGREKWGWCMWVDGGVSVARDRGLNGIIGGMYLPWLTCQGGGCLPFPGPRPLWHCVQTIVGLSGRWNIAGLISPQNDESLCGACLGGWGLETLVCRPMYGAAGDRHAWPQTAGCLHHS